jgi:hypothetical protein
MRDAVPILDVSGLRSPDPAARRAVAAALGAACRGPGFVLVTGHGIAPGLFLRRYAREVSRRWRRIWRRRNTRRGLRKYSLKSHAGAIVVKALTLARINLNGNRRKVRPNAPVFLVDRDQVSALLDVLNVTRTRAFLQPLRDVCSLVDRGVDKHSARIKSGEWLRRILSIHTLCRLVRRAYGLTGNGNER